MVDPYLNMCSKLAVATQERGMRKLQLNSQWKLCRQIDLKHLKKK